jgi:hypothetical protein
VAVAWPVLGFGVASDSRHEILRVEDLPIRGCEPPDCWYKSAHCPRRSAHDREKRWHCGNPSYSRQRSQGVDKTMMPCTQATSVTHVPGLPTNLSTPPSRDSPGEATNSPPSHSSRQYFVGWAGCIAVGMDEVINYQKQLGRLVWLVVQSPMPHFYWQPVSFVQYLPHQQVLGGRKIFPIHDCLEDQNSF